MPLITFLSAFTFIFLSELGDKTMLTTLCLSAQNRRPWTVLFAAMLALGIATIIGVLVGMFLSLALPLEFIIFLSSILFILMGTVTLRSDDETLVCETDSPRNFFNMFALVLFSELGDKSQIVILALSSTSLYPLLVVIGALLGFLLVNLAGAFAGDRLAEKLPVRAVRITTGVVFIVFGILSLVTLL